MKKFSPPEMKEVSFPTPHTPHPTPYTLHPTPSFKSGDYFLFILPTPHLPNP
ncbi:MAG: hypothetical protein PX481_13855 [Microcystis sp. M53603_WE2]|jgi:DNA gyrase subunit A|uniref:hypothetical protein n=1 Tax=unclassified Microcystis TaxID=2643300 RepID=UPI0022C9881A|nr:MULTISPECIES: hypothetical protein [unclassified Microcystis]MCE2661827.1 hypothetical protein [Microcystis sp. 53602_E8]MCZ8363132.1 hypothetical protein [Microcystis sp. LE19-251.1A]MDJ0566668.1 hypothetical protein [Microcystis sp. M49629_WE12]MCZ8025475.1 hypothetical protein [Microcystis sp. LE19-10.1B]MDJ0539745.1 hypothetical protein [Microcystis sp. M53603_WE2]